VFRKPWWLIVFDVAIYVWIPVAGIAAAVLLGWWGALGLVFTLPGLLLLWREPMRRTAVSAVAAESFTYLWTRRTPVDHVSFAVQRVDRRPAYLVHECGGGELLGPVATRARIDEVWWDRHWGADGVTLHQDSPTRSGLGKKRTCDFPRAVRWPRIWEGAVLAAYAIAVLIVAGNADPMFSF
jgi:hypothetical protein